MSLPPNERAAQIMEHLVSCNRHGYSQYSRNGDGGSEMSTLSDGSNVTIATGDRDCSSAVIDAYRSAGVDVGGATYTGNMRSCMCGTGNFEWMPMSYTAQRGDIYLNEVSHTAMCTSAVPDMLAEFSISENGTIDGVEGDQTGYESHIRTYYDYPWNGILRYIGEGASSEPSFGGSQSSGVPAIMLQARTTDGTVLPATSYPDFAGWKANGPIQFLSAWCTDSAWRIDVQAYTAADGWLPWLINPSNINDLDNGAVGNSGPILGLKMYLYSPNADYAVHYQVNCGNGYYPEQTDTDVKVGMDGYAGDLSNPIYEVKAYIGGL